MGILDGVVAVVTGAGGGIGTESARLFAAEVMATWGRVDVLLNNAGMALQGGLLGTSVADWNRVMAVNTTSTWLMMKHLVPAMDGSGSIVNISSVAALMAVREASAYTASKGAVLSLTRVAAAELGPGIRVNCICPGTVRTAMPQEMLRNRGGGDADRAPVSPRRGTSPAASVSPRRSLRPRCSSPVRTARSSPGRSWSPTAVSPPCSHHRRTGDGRCAVRHAEALQRKHFRGRTSHEDPWTGCAPADHHRQLSAPPDLHGGPGVPRGRPGPGLPELQDP